MKQEEKPFEAIPSARAVVVYRKPGRPLEITKAICDEICHRVSCGETIRAISQDDHMPWENTIYKWLSRFPEFSESLTRARKTQADFMAEEMLRIIDDGSNDYMERFDKDGVSMGWFLNGEHVQRSKLRFEGRKWLMQKFNPEKYADKTTVSGDKDNPIKTVHEHSIVKSILQSIDGKTAGLPCKTVTIEQK